MINKLKYPNFLIIGAGKAGTTSLYRYLNQHPDVYLADVKDSEFFAMEGKKPVAREEDPESLHHHPNAVYDLESYQGLFDDVTTEKAVGEASTIYLYDKYAYTVIKKYVPEVKMIAVFRDPVDRLYSRWLHLVRDDRKPSASFSDALNRQSIWWRRNDLIWEGFYYKHLSKFFEIFDRSQILVKFYDELLGDSVAFTRDMFEFLDVDPNFKPDTTARYNVSGVAKSKLVNRLIGGNSKLRKLLKKRMPGALSWMRKQNALQGIVTQLRRRNLKTPPLDPEIRKRLIEEVYKEDILKFQELVNRDLSHWLK